MNEKRLQRAVSSRRRFVKAVGGAAVNAAVLRGGGALAQVNEQPDATILDVQISDGVTMVASNGVRGSFLGSRAQDLETLRSHGQTIRELLIGRDPLDRRLNGSMLWEAVYPGRAKRYAEGRDPLTGEVIAGKARGQRHTKTGRVFMAFSTVDIALWDLRGKLIGKPAYQIIGDANRSQVPVYWRPGEADKGLDDARRRAREAYDRGYHYQKWYLTKAAKDGPSGMKENVDFVQSDPVWCGGISEWLEVCGLVQEHPGVKVVPHITSPWIAAPHCVASQAEGLCPLLEFNYEGGRKALDGGMTRSSDGGVVMRMPSAPGIT